MATPTYVYNDDGFQPMVNVRPGHVKRDLERWLDCVLDTPVQAYVLCTAHPEVCFHNTKVGELFGVRPGVRASNPSFRHRVQAQEELTRQGTDELRVMAERARARGKTFLAGMRMSDAHHRWPGNDRPEEYPLFPKYTIDHPEYRIRNKDGSLDVTLDYSHEPVRAHRLAILHEIFHDYPVDGVELDFMRFCSHFQRPASTEQIAIMNGLVREIRKMLDAEGRTKGVRERPILGVRVPPALAECAPNGLDPDAWVREKTVDYLNPADFLWADFNIPVDDYLSVCRGADCPVLYGILPWPAAPWNEETRVYSNAFPVELPEYRAMAANARAAGAHGLHCFNLCCEMPGREKDICKALEVMSSDTSVYAGPRHYQFFPSEAGATPTGANSRQTLRFEDTGTPLAFRFNMADGLRKDSVRGHLAWRIYNSVEGDQWLFKLNGQEISRRHVRDQVCYAGHPVRTGVELPAHRYFEADFRFLPALSFHNTLEITPVKLDDTMPARRSMEVLEAWAKDR